MLVLKLNGFPFNNVERAAGCTKWNFKSLFSYALEGMFFFSTAPLKLAGVFGVFLFIDPILYLFIPPYQLYYLK